MASKERDLRLKMQKTCFIGTVNLGHICKKTDWTKVPEEEILEELRLHWNDALKLPNLKIARGQIERNKAGVLHINFGLKFSKVWRARTLQNILGCWADPAENEAAVMAYGKKLETRVEALPNFGQLKKNKTGPKNPKAAAIQMLLDGMTPAEICAADTAAYFTHHRAILETWKMLEHSRKCGKRIAQAETEEEE